MTAAEAMQLLGLLKALFPRQVIQPETAMAYAAFLEDLDFGATEVAVRRIVATRDFFPTVAEIRREVASARVAHLASPELAWADVERAIGQVGAYGYPLFEGNPAMNAAIDAVGWRNICLDENIAASRARFVDAYRSARDREQRAQQVGQLAPASTGAPPRVRISNAGAGVQRMPDPARPELEQGASELAGKLLAGRFPSKRGA